MTVRLPDGLKDGPVAIAFSPAVKEAYRNPHMPVDARVSDLIGRMTLEEKIGQMLCLQGWETYRRTKGGAVINEDFTDIIGKLHAGGLYAVQRADPWTKKTFDNGLDAKLGADVLEQMQRYAIEETRLGIPLLLLEALAATGMPLITVYIQGRALDMRDASNLSDALLTAWYPGEQGGTAIASVLFGDTGPSGRLPISVPLDAGQLPAYYSQGSQSDYTDMPSAPLYPFGYGLTYTEFEYGKISIDTADFHNAGNLRISVRITNTGTRHGTETVQLYIRDKVSSYRVCDLRLAAFERVSLAPGESSVAEFTLDKDALAYYFPDGRKVFEDGEFEIMAGASSTDIRSTEILKGKG